MYKSLIIHNYALYMANYDIMTLQSFSIMFSQTGIMTTMKHLSLNSFSPAFLLSKFIFHSDKTLNQTINHFLQTEIL